MSNYNLEKSFQVYPKKCRNSILLYIQSICSVISHLRMTFDILDQFFSWYNIPQKLGIADALIQAAACKALLGREGRSSPRNRKILSVSDLGSETGYVDISLLWYCSVPPWKLRQNISNQVMTALTGDIRSFPVSSQVNSGMVPWNYPWPLPFRTSLDHRSLSYI
jgi:hypothetical protein